MAVPGRRGDDQFMPSGSIVCALDPGDSATPVLDVAGRLQRLLRLRLVLASALQPLARTPHLSPSHPHPFPLRAGPSTDEQLRNAATHLDVLAREHNLEG